MDKTSTRFRIWANGGGLGARFVGSSLLRWLVSDSYLLDPISPNNHILLLFPCEQCLSCTLISGIRTEAYLKKRHMNTQHKQFS